MSNQHVGIDLVDVAEVRDALAQHGPRYLERVYAPSERETDPSRLAVRFAAKEAVLKALRPDPGAAVPWPSIAITVPDRRPPSVTLSGAAAALSRTRGVTTLSVSLHRRGGHALAVALAGGDGA